MGDVIKLANSSTLYLVAAGLVVLVIVEAIFFLVKAWREAIRIGMEKELLKKVATSSATFTLVPSLGILIGVIALAPGLGIPLPWMRLSVVGALHYEGPTANNIAKGLGLGDLSSPRMTGADLSSIVFGMTFGIIWGILFVFLFYKAYAKRIRKVTTEKPEETNFVFNAMFLGLVATYVGDAISQIRYMNLSDGRVRTPNVLPLLAVVVAVLAMHLFTWLIEKKNVKWLENFSFSFAMVLGMIAAVIGQYIFPQWSSFIS
jgi:hypothetical protein